MKKLMTLATVLVLLASFAVGAYGAVDLQKKPGGPESPSRTCYYACVNYGTYYEILYCCPVNGGYTCELYAQEIGTCSS